MKWEIWESRPEECRQNLNGNEWNDYIAARFREWPYINWEYINDLIFKPKGITEPAEAFEHLKQLKTNLKNSFLFRSK